MDSALVDISVLISNFFNQQSILHSFKNKFLYLEKIIIWKILNIITNNNFNFNINSLGFRYDNIVIEFEQYGLSSLLRNIVGASKISLQQF